MSYLTCFGVSGGLASTPSFPLTHVFVLTRNASHSNTTGLFSQIAKAIIKAISDAIITIPVVVLTCIFQSPFFGQSETLECLLHFLFLGVTLDLLRTRAFSYGRISTKSRLTGFAGSADEHRQNNPNPDYQQNTPANFKRNSWHLTYGHLTSFKSFYLPSKVNPLSFFGHSRYDNLKDELFDCESLYQGANSYSRRYSKRTRPEIRRFCLSRANRTRAFAAICAETRQELKAYQKEIILAQNLFERAHDNR